MGRSWVNDWELFDAHESRALVDDRQRLENERFGEMTNINDMFPSRYLSAADLGGQDKTYTIERVYQDEVGEDRELKWIVKFAGEVKALVLNKTNGVAIAALHGEENKQWIGKAVTLYPTKTQFGAKVVDAIRVRLEGGEVPF